MDCAGIHGWGIFARKAIPQDTAVFEYKGDSVGPKIGEQALNPRRGPIAAFSGNRVLVTCLLPSLRV